MTAIWPLSAREKTAWLRLARTHRVGPVTFAQLLIRFGDAQSALEALPKLAKRGGGDPPTPPPLSKIEDELARLDAFGGVLLASCEPTFPALLRSLDPPPPVLSVCGHVGLLSQTTLAIVGSRNASAVGQRFARDLAVGLGAEGVIVVSGLARGIDAAAHAGARATGTIAVVAGGVDQLYPPENKALYEALRHEGAVVSEVAFGAPPTARDFPRRNRIISGLSLGVVVIEAAQRSGSLITARYAGEQGREVMAAPGSPLDPRARGANGLIRDGAHLVEGPGDVLAILRSLPPPALREDPRDSYAGAAIDHGALDAEADAVRDQVRALLSPTPTSRDEIVRASGVATAIVAAALSELELAGIALQLPGGLVCLAPPADAPDPQGKLF